jgi:hypothetical protein
MRRILIIGSIIIVIIGLAIGAYFFFFAKNSAGVPGGNPFANTSDTGTVSNPSTVGVGTPIKAGEEIAPHLIKITSNPVAGGTIGFAVGGLTSSTTASTTVVESPDTEIRYIDRASGNIYQFLLHARTLTRLSNRTLPGIQEASWADDGSVAYVRFLSQSQDGTESVETYALPGGGGEGGTFFEQNLDQATVFATSSVFSLLSGTNGSIGSISRTDGSASRIVFSSLIGSLVVHPTRSMYLATNRASYGLDGYGFLINPQTGAFTRILGSLRGLSVLPSPSGKLALYSYVDQGALHLSVINTETREATALPLATLTEKCAWASDNLAVYCGIPRTVTGRLPDDWYQGVTSFSDRIWRIDLLTRTATLVIDPKEAGDVSLDVANPSIDPATDAFVFRNKFDSSLWAYDF